MLSLSDIQISAEILLRKWVVKENRKNNKTNRAACTEIIPGRRNVSAEINSKYISKKDNSISFCHTNISD